MKGTIEINGLRLFARHGVYDEERIYPIEQACQTDDVNDTLNYAEAIEIIKREMEIPSRLLEHAAARIRIALINRFPSILSGYIRLTKLNPPLPVDIDGTAVSLEW